jgi:uncharacterized membrane protein (UPF0127 family)
LVLRAFNTTRQTVVAMRLRVRVTFFGRLIGLLGRSGLRPGEGLWISPCRAIHTIGMRFSLDVIFLDHGNKVVRTEAGVAPFRVCLGGREARSVIELPVGTLKQSCTVPDDLIEFIKDV